MDNDPAEGRRREPPWLVGLALCAASFFCAGYALGLLDPPHWFQPTVLGAAWGLSYFMGVLLASVLHGRGTGAVAAVLISATSVGATATLTDLGLNGSTLVACGMLASGWLVGRFGVAPRLAELCQSDRPRPSLFDLVVWTTIIAVSLAAAQGWGSAANGRAVASPHGLPGDPIAVRMFVLVAAMAAGAGAVCSWAAVRAVFAPKGGIAVFVGSLVSAMAISVCLPDLFAETAELGGILRWAAAGPVQASAAESVAVLVLASLLRAQRTYAVRLPKSEAAEPSLVWQR